MTAQVAETLTHLGEQHSMCTEPLSAYFGLGGYRPPFVRPHTACWRGYVGSWEIIDDRLYLVALKGWLENGEVADLETVFPDYPTRVFAHWFTGSARLPQGKRLEYVHMGYGSKFERDCYIDFEKGCVVSTRMTVNGVGADDGVEGYGVAALTVLPHGDLPRRRS